jgi:type II secretory pathway component PulK
MDNALDAIWLILLPVILVAAAAGWLIENQEDRIRRWHREGKSQAWISARLNITRYRVRKVLAG